MGLLAGEKRKQKIGLDPNNMTWAKDTSSVGQSMLRKMGWKEGAGLGANEDGRVAPVKASMKCNSAGLGCTARQTDSWIAHGEEFDQILATLNASTKTEDGVGSPVSGRNSPNEEIEGQRRYYGRFSRGGVKRERTAEDLKCIFGRRKASVPPVEILEEKTNPEEESNDSTEEKNESQNKNIDKSHGVETVTSSYSVQDYFAQKLKNLKQKKKDGDKNMNVETDAQEPIKEQTNEQDSDMYSTMKQDTQDDEKQDFNSYVTSNCSLKDYFSQKMKAKNAKLAAENCNSLVNKEDNHENENIITGEYSNDDKKAEVEGKNCETSIKMKKKKKKRKTETLDITETDSALDHINQSTHESFIKDKKEKKKSIKKKVEFEEICNDNLTVNVECEEDASFATEKIEKKKKKKRKTDVDGNGDNRREESCIGEKTEKKKNRKRKTEEKETYDDDSNIDINGKLDENCSDDKTNKKKKKKKRKIENEDVDSSLVVAPSEASCTENKASKKKKKRRSES